MSTQLIEASTVEMGETLALVESNPRCLPHFLMPHQKYDDIDDDDDDDDDGVDYSSFCQADVCGGFGDGYWLNTTEFR